MKLDGSTRARLLRRPRCGAVLVEGLIVASMLALFLAGCVFVHSLYSAKLRTVADARHDAWVGALRGCEGGLLTALINSFGVITALTEVEQAGLADTPDWLTGMGRHTGNPPARNVTASPLLGGGSYRLQTRTSVACNELGGDENGGLLLSLAGLIRQVAPF